jgi:hypothetical protein
MATTKSSAKVTPGKRPAPASTVAVAKVKPATKAKLTAKAEPAVKAKATSKAKAAPKAAAKKPARPRTKKSSGISPEQRRNYVEVAAYHIAERRGFAPGNPMEDWVQAEAEIDRLLAEGHLGG